MTKDLLKNKPFNDMLDIILGKKPPTPKPAVEEDRMVIEFSSSKDKPDKMVSYKNGKRYECSVLVFNEEETAALIEFLKRQK